MGTSFWAVLMALRITSESSMSMYLARGMPRKLMVSWRGYQIRPEISFSCQALSGPSFAPSERMFLCIMGTRKSKMKSITQRLFIISV